MKRIVTIQDISCVGKCSLTVALPIISAMGVETAVVPTAVLSTHTAFKGFTFRDLTDDIQKIADHWKQEKIGFDAIYTGYLGSFKQLELMSKFFDDFGGTDKIVFVDPCMADNGSLYPGFTQEFAFAMSKLCGKADIIAPNITEACYMLGIPYPGDNYDEKYIHNLMEKLAALGAKKVVLKGIAYNKGKCGVLTYDAASKKYTEYFHEMLPVKFHGTGDIFASVTVGALMRGKTLEQAVKLAADYTVLSIKKTLEHKDYNWYGVDFEAAFPFLVKALEK